MTSSVICRRGNLEDLCELDFAEELAITKDSIEFNVLGMGHEFWVAIKDGTIVGFAVLANIAPNQRTIMYLQVANLHEGQGIGSALLSAAIENYPESDFSVIPSDGTKDFYRRLGFQKRGQWEMHRLPLTTTRESKS